jgi:hypothetical protein
MKPIHERPSTPNQSSVIEESRSVCQKIADGLMAKYVNTVRIGPDYISTELSVRERDHDVAALRAHDDMLAALRAVRDSFFFADDDGSIGLSCEAENHHFAEVCAAIKKAEGE